jgi:hypothetical protein
MMSRTSSARTILPHHHIHWTPSSSYLVTALSLLDDLLLDTLWYGPDEDGKYASPHLSNALLTPTKLGEVRSRKEPWKAVSMRKGDPYDLSFVRMWWHCSQHHYRVSQICVLIAKLPHTYGNLMVATVSAMHLRYRPDLSESWF